MSLVGRLGGGGGQATAHLAVGFWGDLVSRIVTVVPSARLQYHAHKGTPTKQDGAVGITSKEQDFRNPANRFQHDGKHFGQINPLSGPGPVAGVTANHQPHEIDRFDNPTQHYGHINPLAGPGVIAGVSSSHQPHEIDRFDNAVEHHGGINPNVGPGVVAGVSSAMEPQAKEINRFQNMGSASSSRQGTPSRVRQPPGGNSTFTFG